VVKASSIRGSRLRFGQLELNLPEGKLLKRGLLVRLENQPLQVLGVLLEHPGEAVSREELCTSLWPDGTYVDFDEGLNTAIKKLRYALGDSAENPTFIETIPRRGYRFIAPVTNLHDGGQQDELTSERHGPALTDPEPELKEITEFASRAGLPVGSFVRHTVRLGIGWGLAALVCALAAFALFSFRHSSQTRPAMHFSIALQSPIRDLALSPDGKVLAFIAPQPKQGGTVLWVEQVGGNGAHPLVDTEGASYPFWSPDSKTIGFFADGKLKKIDSAGGPVQILCDAPIGRGGTWNREGVIVFAPDGGVALGRVAAGGGIVTRVTGFEQLLATTMSNRWPVFLPDGKHFLYTSVDFGTDLQGEASAINLASLDSTAHQRLLTSSSNVAYVPPGYLLFFRNGTLMAQRFDAERQQLQGDSFAVANDVAYLSSVARALFSVSQNGTLVYQRSDGTTFSHLEWFDRNGKHLGGVDVPARYANPKLSPDGKRVAVDIDDPQSFNTDIWILGPSHSEPRRLTFDPGQDEAPLWSHDGSRIMWLTDRGGKNSFYVKAADRSGVEQSVTASVLAGLSFASAPSDWSSDGRFLLYTDMHEGTGLHLWVLPLTGAAPYRLVDGAAADVEGQFSPDCRWVAYSSNESGHWEVYVAPFPRKEGKYQISTDGGQQPRWRKDGKELFFLSRDRELMAVSVKGGTKFEFTAPRALFETQAHEPITAEEFFTYDASGDGQNFVINMNEERNNPLPVDIILNWPSQLTK
jgi:Tol biopolymer transport system component/DNA-binding winged helix-turn-helix (wHTH) protein